jgi:hypothetical protein
VKRIIGLLARVVPPEWWSATGVLWTVVPCYSGTANDEGMGEAA